MNNLPYNKDEEDNELTEGYVDSKGIGRGDEHENPVAHRR